MQERRREARRQRDKQTASAARPADLTSSGADSASLSISEWGEEQGEVAPGDTHITVPMIGNEEKTLKSGTV